MSKLLHFRIPQNNLLPTHTKKLKIQVLYIEKKLRGKIKTLRTILRINSSLVLQSTSKFSYGKPDRNAKYYSHMCYIKLQISFYSCIFYSSQQLVSLFSSVLNYPTNIHLMLLWASFVNQETKLHSASFLYTF